MKSSNTLTKLTLLLIFTLSACATGRDGRTYVVNDDHSQGDLDRLIDRKSLYKSTINSVAEYLDEYKQIETEEYFNLYIDLAHLFSGKKPRTDIDLNSDKFLKLLFIIEIKDFNPKLTYQEYLTALRAGVDRSKAVFKGYLQDFDEYGKFVGQGSSTKFKPSEVYQVACPLYWSDGKEIKIYRFDNRMLVDSDVYDKVQDLIENLGMNLHGAQKPRAHLCLLAAKNGIKWQNQKAAYYKKQGPEQDQLFELLSKNTNNYRWLFEDQGQKLDYVCSQEAVGSDAIASYNKHKAEGMSFNAFGAIIDLQKIREICAAYYQDNCQSMRWVSDTFAYAYVTRACKVTTVTKESVQNYIQTNEHDSIDQTIIIQFKETLKEMDRCQTARDLGFEWKYHPAVVPKGCKRQ